jgi:hypothetical protein
VSVGSRPLLWAAAIAWALSMTAGLYFVWRYETTPGEVAGDAPRELPTLPGLGPADGRATVVMLAHPKCPCTRASIGELHSLFSQMRGAARGVVLFMIPRERAKEWQDTDTWRRAAEIPGVQVVADEDGLIAAQLGAKVSGHTVVYDQHGKLVFAGGITSARGHMGDNAGRSAIVALLGDQGETKGQGVLVQTPTFGCGLADAPGRGP